MSVLIAPRLIDSPKTSRAGGSGGSGQPDDLGRLLACILIRQRSTIQRMAPGRPGRLQVAGFRNRRADLSRDQRSALCASAVAIAASMDISLLVCSFQFRPHVDALSASAACRDRKLVSAEWAEHRPLAEDTADTTDSGYKCPHCPKASPNIA